MAFVSRNEWTRTLHRYRGRVKSFLQGVVRDTLEGWRLEAEEDNDIVTASVVHAYIALLYSNLQPDELTPESVSALLGSLAYVRNWHGFGMGLRSGNDSGMSAETRLMRWLQAQGVDTGRMVRPGQLKQYLNGRPLYLKVGFEVIRAPQFVASQGAYLCGHVIIC
jgi:hypothetical protein